MNKVWTKEEKQYIIDHANTMKDIDMVIALSQMTKRNITLQSLRKQRRGLGIIKKSGRGICKVIIKNDAANKGRPT